MSAADRQKKSPPTDAWTIAAIVLLADSAWTLWTTGSSRAMYGLIAVVFLLLLGAADVSWELANVAVQTYGGFGFAEEYDIERKFRETRLYQVAPISTNLILSFLAEHVLGLPRSY